MCSSLGVGNSIKTLTLNDFSENQLSDYLMRGGWTGGVPIWLPSRPLLLGYLASRDLLSETLKVDAPSTPSEAWHNLLDRICKREAEIEAGVDGETVRRMIESMASLARKKPDGLGSFFPDDIIETFKKICGFPPDERGMVVLQRLPGLGVDNPEEGSRKFIDVDLADTARAGEVYHFIEDSFNSKPTEAESWQHSLGELGLDVLVSRCLAVKYSDKKVSASLEFASSNERWGYLCSDIARLIAERRQDYQGTPIHIDFVEVPAFYIYNDSGDMSKINYRKCILERIELDMDTSENVMPKFNDCNIAYLEGRVSDNDMPKLKFISCDIEEFQDTMQTSAAILRSSLPVGVKVLLTALRKLYEQSGNGRKENAFYRGHDHSSIQLVPQILEIINRHDFSVKTKGGGEIVWLPVRSMMVRVRQMLGTPTISQDPLIVDARKLKL